MRRVLCAFVLSVMPVVAAEPAKGGLKPGNSLPGTFQPYNVTGPNKGRFHCLVSDYGLEPTVVIFVRGLEIPDPLKELLKQLDDRIEKNPLSRLHAFVVFLSDELPDVLANNDKRMELASGLENQASALMLKHVVFTLDSPKDVEKYDLGDAWATAVLYDKYRVEAIESFAKADAAAGAEKTLAAVDKKLQTFKKKR